MKQVMYFTLMVSGAAMFILGIVLTALAIINPEAVEQFNDVQYNEAMLAMIVGGGFLAFYSNMMLMEDVGPYSNEA